MGIGIGIVLLVVGLILKLNAVTLPDSLQNHIDQDALGWILIIVGVLAIILALVMNAQRQRTTHVERRPPDGI